MRRSHDEIRAFVAQRAAFHEPTPEELIMRGVLTKLDGWRWEYPITVMTKNGGVYEYCLDFYHPRAQLCIEIDGKHHYSGGRLRGRDRRRDVRLRTIGNETLRFTNRDITEGLEQARAYIAEQLAKRLDKRIATAVEERS
jgi:hypothetical protein